MTQRDRQRKRGWDQHSITDASVVQVPRGVTPRRPVGRAAPRWQRVGHDRHGGSQGGATGHLRNHHHR